VLDVTVFNLFPVLRIGTGKYPAEINRVHQYWKRCINLFKLICPIVDVQAAAINVAEGNKQAKILESEAEKQQLINAAQGSAQAVVAAGEARAKSIHAVAEVLAPIIK
jgi:hypothetical protein